MRQALLIATLALSAPAWAEAPSWTTPQAVAQTFVQGCVLTSGDAAAGVDWALSQGFEPVDPMRGSMDGLLGGQPGSVLAAPGSNGHVLLVAAEGRKCTVWVDGMAGPAMRSAAAEAIGALASKGKVLLQADRNLERAGAWRNQMQWRWRGVGVPQDFGLGVVTTLSATPGTQALHLEPLPAMPAYAPDGVPTR